MAAYLRLLRNLTLTARFDGQKVGGCTFVWYCVSGKSAGSLVVGLKRDGQRLESGNGARQATLLVSPHKFRNLQPQSEPQNPKNLHFPHPRPQDIDPGDDIRWLLTLGHDSKPSAMILNPLP
jgi:hypothetical protein